MFRTTKQLPLPFEPGWEAKDGLPIFEDPAFMDNRSAPIHRWVPWIAGFSGAFVDSVMSSYLNHQKNSGFVLDPFAGVGTTLVQAAIRGYRVVGFEINPYASLSANVKLNAMKIDTRELEQTIAQMKSASRKWCNGGGDPMFAPRGFRSRIPFFSPRVEAQVFQVLEFISKINNNPLKDLFRVAFGAVMVSFSNYTYEPSLSTRTAAGKPWINDADVAGTLLEKLRQMQSDINWLRAKAVGEKIEKGFVYNEDFFEGKRRMENGSVHLMVTSPPYLNNYHYARNTRPQLYWLGLISSPKEQKCLEEMNFGTFWQIARTKDPVSLNFTHGELERILARLRQLNPEKREYGGLGWANYAASYFNDCERFLNALKRCLRKNGTGVIVVGNSILQGINIKVQDILGDIAKMCGLKLEGIYRLRDKRVGDSITGSSVRGASSKARLDESAVVVRKL
jgi:DNA modification methylase